MWEISSPRNRLTSTLKGHKENMRKLSFALAAFVLLATMAFLPSTATAKVPNLLTAPKSKLFNQTDQCTICGYALENPSDTSGVPNVAFRVVNITTNAYYDIYTDSVGYFEDKIDLDSNWRVYARDIPIAPDQVFYPAYSSPTSGAAYEPLKCYSTSTVWYLPFSRG